jgi:hypothetical protein
MAEKLPRYRPLGVSIASVPAIDFAGAKMKARGFDQTAAALDKISSFAFKKAGEYKVEEAQKFRYDNPVTAEQLQTAISSGRDIDEIIGDNYTIFGRASRATVGAEQAEVRKQIRTERSARISSRKSANEERGIGYSQEAQKFMREMVKSPYGSDIYNAAKTNLETIAIASNGSAISMSSINTFDASLSTASGREATTPPSVYLTLCITKS